jgi:hypothetical protein
MRRGLLYSLCVRVLVEQLPVQLMTPALLLLLLYPVIALLLPPAHQAGSGDSARLLQ